MRTRTCLRQAIAAAAVLCTFVETTRADYVLYRDMVLADSPVAYWRLGESGSPFISQVGTYSGSDAGHLVTTGVSGPQAADYLGFESGNRGIGVANTTGNNPAANYISVNHAAALNPGTGNWSVEAWVYIPSTGRPASGESWIVAKMGTTANNYVRDGYAMSFDFATLRPSLSVRDFDGTYADAVLGVSGPALAADTWYHLVATLERGAGSSATVRMYVNSTAGSTVNSGSSSVLDKPLNSDKNLAIGSSSNGRYGFWGQIDEVAVYNYALTASQVATHFAAAEFDPAARYWSGAGQWNTTNANWGAQSGTHSGTAWGVGVNDAVFEGTGGMVTIAEALPTARSLAFHADGYTLSGGTLRLAGEATVATAAGATARVHSTVAGAASLTKTGAGTLVLGGPTTYAGDTTVDGGTLILASVANANYASGNFIVNAGTLQIGESEQYAGNIFNSAARTITVNGGGTLRFLTRNAFGGSAAIATTKVVIDGGTVTSSANSTGATNVLQDLTLRNGAILEVTNPFAGVHATYNVKGTVTVEGTSPSAITLASGGTGWIGIGNSIEHNTVTIFNVADVTGDNTADLTITAPIRNGYRAGEGLGSLTSGLTKTGAGTLVLAGPTTYTGDTLVDGGTLILSSTTGGRFASGNFVVNAGTLQLGESEISIGLLSSASRTITVNSGGTLSFINRNAFGDAMSTPTTTVVIDGGTVTSSTGSVGATNVLRNLTLRNGANLEVTKPLGPYATYNLKGTVTVDGMSPSAITLASGGTGWIGIGDSVSAGTVTTFDVADVTGDQAADLVVSASIRNGHNNGSLMSGLTKTGAGTLLLNAVNTYTGLTIVSTGTLHVGATGSLTAGLPVHLAEGAEYKVTLSPANFANVHSQLTSTAADALQLPAAIIDGEAAALGSTVTMAWRVRTGQEVASNQIFSDVLSLSASLGTSNLPLYVLAMQYDDSLAAGAVLGWWDTDSDAWMLATADNSGNNASAAQLDYQGSFAAFQAEHGTTLADYVGAYGVDPNQNLAWAVLNHASEFAVMVPEPGSLLLLGSAFLGLLGLAGRRRNHRTWNPRG